MSAINIPWSPRLIMAGRIFRLPVQAEHAALELEAAAFEIIDSRWSEMDKAFFYYLKTPSTGGTYPICARQHGCTAQVSIQVRTLNELRTPYFYNGTQWPRRWPLDQSWHSTKTAQTLQDWPKATIDREAFAWWNNQQDAVLWHQLPAAEYPRAHFVNVHQGCPQCGTAIFAHHGFYPWQRHHTPYDLRSQCPACNAHFPSNDLRAGDFSSGDFVDDGFGYFDADGKVFLFAASSHRDLVSLYNVPINLFTQALRQGTFAVDLARKLGLLLLRYAQETIYLAAAPQFRHGPSQEVEQAWDWGQPDWAATAEPIAALYRKGMLRYSIDIPSISESLALAYDTIWPFIRHDQALVDRAQALGLEINSPADTIDLIEEMLASLLQCSLDGGGLSNLPRVSEGVLVVLRALQRPDAQDALSWLYEKGPDKLRVFTSNNFFADGMPPEATGGYNDIHTRGLFSLEYHLRQLRQACPGAFPESRFPSLLADPRVPRIVAAPYEIALLGRVPFHFGDGGSAGVQTSLADRPPLAPLPQATLERAAEYLPDPSIIHRRNQVKAQTPSALGPTVHDGVGFAILRTGEAPERAAAGLVYGDTTGHRHMDLLDVQLYAFDQPFLSDLGYPQSWSSIEYWEGNWATHNSVWATVPDLGPLKLPFDTPWPFLKQIAGRGRLRRFVSQEKITVAEVEAQRWCWDLERRRWFRPGVYFRRLIALVETDGEGIALVDLARIRGGNEHWRVCRGLEGQFLATGIAGKKQPGTVANLHGQRGQRDKLPHPDYGALACMDDVELLDASTTWQGTWNSSRQADTHLDLHQVAASAPMQLRTARATAAMGTPEQSNYNYRTLLWNRTPAHPDETSSIDLVFEPRIGPATLAHTQTILAQEGPPGASGIELETYSGRQIRLYWSPEAALDQTTHFADGTQLQGNFAVDHQDKSPAHTTTRAFVEKWQQGSIVALDRSACTIEVEGLKAIHPGERIHINPQGRGHNYRVEQVETIGPKHQRLKLDMTSLQGRARLVSLDGLRLEVDFFLMARTGHLHQTRLERETDGTWAPIAAAMNPDMDSTTIDLEHPLSTLSPGDWISVVDYVVGDPVTFSPPPRDLR